MSEKNEKFVLKINRNLILALKQSNELMELFRKIQYIRLSFNSHECKQSFKDKIYKDFVYSKYEIDSISLIIEIIKSFQKDYLG